MWGGVTIKRYIFCAFGKDYIILSKGSLMAGELEGIIYIEKEGEY